MQIALKTEYGAEDVDVVRNGLIAANRELSGREAGYHPFVFHLIEPEAEFLSAARSDMARSIGSMSTSSTCRPSCAGRVTAPD